jgi:hypothetical protein
MTILKPVYIFFLFSLLSLSGLSQPINHSIDSIIRLITPETYRIHFDSLRTGKGCTRKVYDKYYQSPDHDACCDYIFRTFKKYLGEGNVYLHRFKIGENDGLTNVIAFKEGRSNSKRILVVSAHYDSNNNREPGNSDPECSPGANDNGTGVAAILEIARVLSGVETENSILFAAWDLEEQFPFGFGGGSNCWFTDHIIKRNKMSSGDIKNGGKINIEKLIANINFDMFGHPNDTIDNKPVLWACSGNVIHSDFVNEYVSTFNRYVSEIAVKNQGKLTFSDHYTFAARKIPSVENLESDYKNDPFFHTCSDNLSNIENIDFNFATSVTRGGMAFLLVKSGVFLHYSRKTIVSSIPVDVFELPGEYCIKLPDDVFRVIVNDLYGNEINTFKEEGFTIFYPPVSGLYHISIISQEDRAFRNVFLYKKEGRRKPFF